MQRAGYSAEAAQSICTVLFEEATPEQLDGAVSRLHSSYLYLNRLQWQVLDDTSSALVELYEFKEVIKLLYTRLIPVMYTEFDDLV